LLGGGARLRRGRENNLMREQRAPVAGVGGVFGRAGDEFVPAIGLADEAGVPECGDGFAFVLSEPQALFHRVMKVNCWLAQCCPATGVAGANVGVVIKQLVRG